MNTLRDHQYKKRFGQNFLNDRSVCRRIVDEIPRERINTVMEIGPGLGILTGELLDSGYEVIALEIDQDLCDHLSDLFSQRLGSDLQLHNMDGMRYLNEIKSNSIPFIVSNLPFNISSELIGFLLDRIDLASGSKALDGGIIMFQKEFAKRLVAPPGNKSYGRLSVMFQTKMDYRTLFEVSRYNFKPVPKVDAMVIGFEQKRDPITIPSNDLLFRKLVNVAFMNRRKKLKNSILPPPLNLDVNPTSLVNLLDSNGLSGRRPDSLAPEEFVELSNSLNALQ
ncbi:MAG: 16S rRNA (adenine(1518)-N(6)/adenine(1519)-N(6))-dimethyltransferase RsmA [Thermoplasmatota archaeon]